ncbi:MAG: oligosaccharide flippase family protein [Acidobacteria bacterium]|nr:oligosaccharide flippase family protein [Acidobacteriota bacterium]
MLPTPSAADPGHAPEPSPTGAPPSLAWTLFTGTATKYTLLIANIAIGVFLMPFTVRHLGTAEYGLWMLVASFTYYFQLLDLGYGSGLVRHIAEADARRDLDGVNRVLSTFVLVYAVLGCLAGVGVVGITFLVIPHFPNLPPADIVRAQQLLGIMGVRIAVGFPMTVFGAVTTARQRFALNNMVALVVSVANAVATVLVLVNGGGLVPLVSATTAVGLASYGAYAWTARRAFPEMRIRRSLFDRTIVRDVTAFSIYLFLIDVAIQIGFNLDNIVVGGVLGTTAVGIYAVALRLADYQRQLCVQFNSLLFPVVVRLGAASQREALRGLLIEGTRIALVLVGGVTVCLIGFGEPLVRTWMGPGFEAAVVPLYVLALTGIVLVGQGPLGNLLLGTGKHRLVAFTALAEALANLALSVVLIRLVGLVGVAIGTAVPILIANLGVLLPVACREAGVKPGALLRQVALPPLIAAMPAAATCAALRMLMPPDHLVGVVAEGALVGVVYLVGLVTIGFDAATRARYRSFLLRLRPQRAGAPKPELRMLNSEL